jgi:hypothetical protein
LKNENKNTIIKCQKIWSQKIWRTDGNSYAYSMIRKRILRTEYFKIIEVIKKYVNKLREEPDEKTKQEQIKEGFYIYRCNLHEYHRELREQNIPYDEADDYFCLGFSDER